MATLEELLRALNETGDVKTAAKQVGCSTSWAYRQLSAPMPKPDRSKPVKRRCFYCEKEIITTRKDPSWYCSAEHRNANLEMKNGW